MVPAVVVRIQTRLHALSLEMTLYNVVHELLEKDPFPTQHRENIGSGTAADFVRCGSRSPKTRTNGSFTVIIMVAWPTIQCPRLSGIARSHTLTSPMIISRSPPEANSFRPLNTPFRICSIFIFLTGTRPELLVETPACAECFGRGISDHGTVGACQFSYAA